jgi:uncharacterized protein YdcH (DUF465 family)
MENISQDELKAHLMATDEHFRELAQLHADYDHQIDVLERKHALSDQDQLEEIRLKKLKLHLKDEMTEIMLKAQAIA